MSGANFKRKSHSHPHIPANIHHPLEPGEFPFAVGKLPLVETHCREKDCTIFRATRELLHSS
eukprot:6675435-Pyramimonas_sp.AAC.1